MKNVNYWYNSQIRTIILHTQRLFSNFYISEGKDENNKNILRRIPCVFMSSDKSAATIINKNTDTIIQSAPKMILTIQDIKLNNELSSGSAYYEYESEITEKKFDDSINNYVYEPDNTYHISRFNPVPIGFVFKLFIVTTNYTQKFQLLEQIRALFNPALELQTSENPLDWTRLTAIVMTGLNWTSRGTMNLDSTTLDTMDMTFEINTNLDLPAIVSHSKIVENIITDIHEGSSLEDIWGWNMEDVIRTYYTPTDTSVIIDKSSIAQLVPTKNYDNWYKILKTYGIKYNKTKNNVYLHCMLNDNIDNRKEIIGQLIIDEKNPLYAQWIIDDINLPQPNIDDIDAIINPHDFTPKNVNGERYLIVEDLGSNSQLWGQLYDKNDNKITSISKNSIIEYDNKWKISLDPLNEPAVYYVRDKSDYKYLYTYNDTYNLWVDVLNKKYRQGYWRLSVL